MKSFRQIRVLCTELGRYLKVRCHACISSADRAERDIHFGGQHLTVGTPHRIYDIVSKRQLRMDQLKIFVVDEVGEVLSRGFKSQICEICKCLPPSVQVCFFSAVTAPEILHVFDSFKRHPRIVQIKLGFSQKTAPQVLEKIQQFAHTAVCIHQETDKLTLGSVQQFFIEIENEACKLDTLCDLFKTLTITQVVIYCNTRRKVDFLKDQLTKLDFIVSVMHADLDQKERELVMRGIRSGSSRVLISTNLPMRSIDIRHFSVFINYDLPLEKEDYLHRIGCNKRLDRKSVAINFVTSLDVRTMKGFERDCQIQIEEMPTDIADIMTWCSL